MLAGFSSGNEKVARIVCSRPIRGRSSRRRAVWRVCRHMNASMSTRPARSAASNASTTSSGCREYGFSHRTCLPAASAVIVQRVVERVR